MKNKTMRKKLGILMYVLLASILLCACEKNEDATAKDTGSKKTEEVANEGYPKGTFDFDELCKYVTIDGKQVGLPFTLKDLGEGYEFDKVGQSDGIAEHKCGSSIKLPDGNKIFVMLREEVISDIKDTSEISHVFVTSKFVDFQVAGIKIGSTEEEVRNLFGEPTSIRDGGGGEGERTYSVWKYEIDKNYLIVTTDGNKIDTITINID